MTTETLVLGICEDDDEEYTNLEMILGKFDIQTEAERFTDGSGLLENYYPGKYDLLLMDIYMDGMNGVETTARVRETDSDVPIAFITTSQDFAMEGYRYQVCRYLVKPLKEEQVRQVLELALREKRSMESVHLQVDGEQCAIPISRILFAEQSNHMLYVHTTGGQIYKSRGKLDELQIHLPEKQFFRCHKSYLVNLNQVCGIDRELSAFELNEGQLAYIRRGSMKQSRHAWEDFMFERTRGDQP